MPKRKAGEIVRYAILHAVDERLGYLDAISHCFEPEWEDTRKEIKQRIKEMQEYYVRRFKRDPWKEEQEFFNKMETVRINASGKLLDSDEDKV